MSGSWPGALFSFCFSAWSWADRFGKVYGLRTCAAFGGLSKHQQFKELRAGVEVRGLIAVCFLETDTFAMNRNPLSIDDAYPLDPS